MVVVPMLYVVVSDDPGGADNIVVPGPQYPYRRQSKA
jgi:hypothetical protein